MLNFLIRFRFVCRFINCFNLFFTKPDCCQCRRARRAHLQYYVEIEFANMNRLVSNSIEFDEEKLVWWSRVAVAFGCEYESSVKSLWGGCLARIVTWFFSAAAVFVACLPILLRLLENIHGSHSLAVGVTVHEYSAHTHTQTDVWRAGRESAVCSTKRIFLFSKHKRGLGAKSMQSPLYVYVIEVSSTCAKLPAFQKFNFIYDFSTTTKLNAHKIWLVRTAFYAHTHTHVFL